MTLEQIYTQKCSERSDINEHLPILREYARRCCHVTEFGVRSIVSTWGLLAGVADLVRAKNVRGEMFSYDLSHPGHEGIIQVNTLAAENRVAFMFLQGDTRQIIINATELLFIDTFHTYSQLKAELHIHAAKVSKYLVMHDTQTFGVKGEAGDEAGLLPAIDWFLHRSPDWKIHAQFYNNNGLTILERKT